MKIDSIQNWFHSKVMVADGIVAACDERGIADAKNALYCAASALVALAGLRARPDKSKFDQFLVADIRLPIG